MTFAQDEMRRFIRNSVTLATETLAEPTGVDGAIRDAMGNVPGSIIDRVSVMDLTGLGNFQVPYAISDLTATGGKVKTNAGTARTAGSDPTLGYAELRPYEVNVTQYIDRNISRLTTETEDGSFEGLPRTPRRDMIDHDPLCRDIIYYVPPTWHLRPHPAAGGRQIARL